VSECGVGPELVSARVVVESDLQSFRELLAFIFFSNIDDTVVPLEEAADVVPDGEALVGADLVDARRLVRDLLAHLVENVCTEGVETLVSLVICRALGREQLGEDVQGLLRLGASLASEKQTTSEGLAQV